jgi:uncharacterized coiled-coil protein SlyX
MRSLEDRVISLEDRLDHQVAMIADIRTMVGDLRAEIRDLRAEIRDLRQEMIRRLELGDQRFTWLVGTQVATLVAIVAVLVGALYH